VAANPAHLEAAQAVVAALSRGVWDNRFDLPRRAVAPAELPPPVEVARAFYASHLTPPDDSYGLVLVRQLPADAGSVFLVIGYNVESRWGAAEIFSAEGEWWASGALRVAAVGWHDLDTVRAAMIGLVEPMSLIPRADVLEWLSQGNMSESVGGRFIIFPGDGDGRTGRFILLDNSTEVVPDFATVEEAQAHAAALHAQS